MMRWHDEWRLLPQRLAWHEPSATAVLADVHLGYSAARQRQGDAIPGRSVLEELQPLLDAARRWAFRNVVVAGDLFEQGYDAELMRQFLALLGDAHLKLAALIPGNHDRGIEMASAPIFAAGCDVAGWQIAHGDRPIDAARVIMGHWHPAVRWRRRKLPCFLTNGQQLVLPAFSLDAAGADVRREPHLRGRTCYAIDGERVFHVDCGSGSSGRLLRR